MYNIVVPVFTNWRLVTYNVSLKDMPTSEEMITIIISALKWHGGPSSIDEKIFRAVIKLLPKDKNTLHEFIKWLVTIMIYVDICIYDEKHKPVEYAAILDFSDEEK
jgi:hypothetical protein